MAMHVYAPSMGCLFYECEYFYAIFYLGPNFYHMLLLKMRNNFLLFTFFYRK